MQEIEGKDIHSPLCREYESMVHSIEVQLEVIKKEHENLKEELYQLVSENEKLTAILDTEFQERMKDAEIDNQVESFKVEIVSNFQKQLDLCKKEKEKTLELYKTSLKLIEKLEEELSAQKGSPTDVNQSKTSLSSSIVSVLEAKLKNARDHLEVVMSGREHLESENIKHQTEIAKLKMNLDSNNKLIDQLKLREGDWKNKYQRLEQEYTLLNATYECVVKSRDELEKKLENYASKVQELMQRNHESRSKVEEALDVVEKALAEKDSAAMREIQLQEEIGRLQLCLEHIIEEAGKKVGAEVEETRKKYEVNMKELSGELSDVKKELEKKKSEYKKISLKYKKLEKLASAKLDKEKINLIKGSETEITILENYLESAYQELERLKVKYEELEGEKNKLEKEFSRLIEKHQDLMKDKAGREESFEEVIRELQGKIELKNQDLNEAAKRTEFFLRQVRELQEKNNKLTSLLKGCQCDRLRAKVKKLTETCASQRTELQAYIESQMKLNEIWKNEIKQITGQFEEKIREVKKQCSQLKAKNKNTFEWPLARPVEHHEILQIQLLAYNKYFSNKIIGYYALVLQTLVENGTLSLSDTLVDLNNRAIPVNVDFEVHYVAPSLSLAWSDNVAVESLEDDQQTLIDLEQNIANLEKSIALEKGESGRSRETERRKYVRKGAFIKMGYSMDTDGTELKSTKTSPFKTVRSLIRFGKHKSREMIPDEEQSLLRSPKSTHCQSSGPDSCTESLAGSVTSLESVEGSEQSYTQLEKPKKLKPTLASVANSILKSQDFQICITIIEARQLAGLNMDPVVCVQVGDQKKYTSVKESTNCPYYNEYFVFDFHMPPVMLFDKIITLSVLQARSLLRSNRMLGSFKLDVATLWAQSEHQFYHKWALLTDPDDVAGGPKGYLKCDMSVMGKGDTVKIPPKSEKDEDDIEANLLLPAGVPVERQRAKFIVRIYRADGLPKMNSSIVANVKKAFTGEVRDLVDPYVQVSFAGLTGKTSVKKHSYSPVWNEQIVFTEMFPPMCQRMKIQLRDNDPVNNTIIGTHFIDLKTISNDGEKGFLPTFGPAFIHLYGSTRDYSLIDEHANLNSGLGEGVSYRARILIAIRTEITENVDYMTNDVEMEAIGPIQEASYGKNEEFYLFATILSATMIDKKIGEKQIYFELSIGNSGNVIDGHNETTHDFEDSDGETGLEGIKVDVSVCHSTTPSTKPMTHDKMYYFLPYWDNKPCMHSISIWPDYRRRMYNSNLISKTADKLEEGLLEVHSLMESEDPNVEKKLKSVLEELSMSCSRYINITKGTSSGPGSGKTKLDKERMKLCQREMEHLATSSRNLKALITKSSFRERYKTANSYLQKLKFLEEDPQHSLPDVFVWAISGNKRLAYHRIPARDIIYSIVDEECGRECGKVQTMFLKLPGKKSIGPSGWTIQVKLQIYMWLGMLKHKKNFINGLPKGYEESNEIKNACRPRAPCPKVIHYLSMHLRAHMYQARSLIGSDASGLSDPFARVIIGEYCKTTQVIDETLSPTWDELLVFEEVLVWGTKEDIKKDPPTIIIEIFDQDKVGKAEFIGRALAKPSVKLEEDPYEAPNFPPPLEWHDIQRGPDHAGELLACFELLEYSKNSRDLPKLPLPKEMILENAKAIDIDMGPILPVPRGIRPTLAKYRIEVLFWGLRDLKRIHLLTVDKPRVDIECAGHILSSSVIQNAKKNPNFVNPVKFIDVELPEQELYRPPLTIRAVDCRSFGRYTLVGTHMINSIHKYMFVPMTKREREARDRQKSLQQIQGALTSPTLPVGNTSQYLDKETRECSPLLPRETTISLGYGTAKGFDGKEPKSELKKKKKKDNHKDLEDDEDSKDWWTKYFASKEATIEEIKAAKKETAAMQSQPNGTVLIPDVPEHDLANPDKTEKKKPKGHSTAAKLVYKLSPKRTRSKFDSNTALMKIYTNDLESQPEYNGFKEWLLSFDLYRGKKTGDEIEDESRVVGTFKGAIKVYKWPLPKDMEDHTVMGFDPQFGFFQGLPSSDPIHVLVRVYIVKANDLHPMDINGKADPYIVLQLGSKRISDKENYISKQLNPVFGKCFEIEATFPQDSLLTIQVFDWDLVGSDEMIGETKIDLESRFYSRHRATCGIPRRYDEFGYNQWRDPMKPTQILAKLCKDGKIDPPIYSCGKVSIGRHTFVIKQDNTDQLDLSKGFEEHAALSVLHKWHEVPRIGCHLVPEHIETRALYNPERPSIEQGKLEMWVDLFPMDMPLPGPPVDISPRKPKSFELRVIIWNTDDVVLEDDAFFTGEKMSDIYVKGWLKGPEDCQYTDIHYRSLTGEGNFNWRFIFPFEYLLAEEKIVISRKESLFSWDETECKIPARLELQVWDADHFSADDFLGAITLDLNRFPRGAKSSKLCTLDMLKADGSVPTVNIFKQKRLKGWWPFYIKKENEEMELTGKVEAEIHLLTKEEAERNPAGCGRNEPDPLEKPNRPDASFMWFLNPLKSVRYVIWHNYKWIILKTFIVLAIAIILLLFFYSIPGYTVKKMLGA